MDARWELVARLASRQETGNAQDLPARLADAFQADGAGLAGPLPHGSAFGWWKEGSRVGSYPWQRDAAPQTSSVIEEANRSWLLVALGGPLEETVLAWVAVSPPRAFQAEEHDLLAAAGLLLWHALERTQPDHLWLQGVRQARLTQRLERSAHLSGKLAHDFGNLLTGILGFAELALTQATPGSISHQFVTEILDSARQGAAWVHRLQAFSRRVSHQHSSATFSDALRREEDRLRAAWPGKATITLDVPDGLSPLAIDAPDLQTVLAQLLDNAFEALDEPGAVTLAARQRHLSECESAALLGQPRPGPFLEITISHDGRSLPAALLSGKLDELFIDSRERRRGLGMLVVYGVLANYGGALAFSQGSSRGATVRAYLPVQAAQSAA